MVRGPWVVALAGGLLVVTSVLLLLSRHAGSTLTVVLGLVGIWIYALLGGVLYEGLARKEVPFQGDPRTWAAGEWACATRWDRPGRVLMLFLPGLWVGALTPSPLPISVG